MQQRNGTRPFGVASIFFLIIVAGLWGSVSAQASDAAASGADATSRLLDLAAQTHGIPKSGAKIADRVTQTLPVTGVTLEIAKVMDKTTEKVVLVATDQTGRPVDPAKMEAAEEKAREARYGKLDARLATRLEVAERHAEMPVSIWVKENALPPNRADMSDASAEAVGLSVQSRIAELKAHTASSRQNVVDALGRMGVQAEQADFSPVVFARLNPGQVRRIASHPDVVTVYGQEKYRLFGDHACTTQRAFHVWRMGNTGANASARVVVHEPDGVQDTNPYLNNLTHPVMFWCPRSWTGTDCNVGKNIGGHATEVAGTIASTHPLYRGMAPNVPVVLSANTQDWSDAKLIRAAEWGIASGGAVTNMSWGSTCGGFQTVHSRWVDWATRNLSHTFVIAAGNHQHSVPYACGSLEANEKVVSPGLAWSVITVGSQDDLDTGFWTGDFMSDFSNWRNPDFATGMEKPEVTAVGDDVMTTVGTGITPAPGVDGTSFAAPMVAGQVAQLVARKPGQIIWPETNKAAVLVSAAHDIEAGTSSRDGLGAVVMNVSDDTYRLNRFVNDSNAGFPLLPAQFPRNHNNLINVTAGTIVRVAIAWDSNSNGSTTDTLGADLDLVVRRADTGTAVCTSSSVPNAWEHCQFTAPVTGNYHVTVNLWNSDAGWPGTFIGVAWGTRVVANFCNYAIPLSIPGTGGSQTLALATANGSTFFDNYPGVSWSEYGRENVYRLTLTATRKISISDTNSSLDIGVIQVPNCAADPIVPTVRAFGTNSAVVNSAPPGTYFIVVDGYNGYVGTTTLTVNVTP